MLSSAFAFLLKPKDLKDLKQSAGFRSGQAQPGPARSSPGAFPAMHAVRGGQLGALRAAARQLVGKVQLRGFTWKNVAREHGNMAQ